jgi:hypothetical protein
MSQDFNGLYTPRYDGVIDYGQYNTHDGHHGCCGCGGLTWPTTLPNTTYPSYPPDSNPGLVEGEQGILGRIFGNSDDDVAPQSTWKGIYLAGAEPRKFSVQADHMWSGRGPSGDLWIIFYNGEDKIAEFVNVLSWIKIDELGE